MEGSMVNKKHPNQAAGEYWRLAMPKEFFGEICILVHSMYVQWCPHGVIHGKGQETMQILLRSDYAPKGQKEHKEKTQKEWWSRLKDEVTFTLAQIRFMDPFASKMSNLQMDGSWIWLFQKEKRFKIFSDISHKCKLMNFVHRAWWLLPSNLLCQIQALTNHIEGPGHRIFLILSILDTWQANWAFTSWQKFNEVCDLHTSLFCCCSAWSCP